MRKIKVVQIGIGHDHAIDVLDSMVAMHDAFEVVALGVPESEMTDFAEKVEICKEKIGVEIMSVEQALALNGIDAAVIETEEENLCKFALLAAEKGLHIHMDKPGGLNESEFENLVNAVKAKGLVLNMGYMYRFNPEIKKIFADVESGKLGEIYCIEAQMNCEHNFKKRQWLKKFPGGMTFFLGCHLVDLIFRIKGQPKEIIPLNLCTDNDIDADDFGMAVFKYENGCSFAKVIGAEIGGFARRQIVVSGEKATVEIRPIEKWLSTNIFSYNGCTNRKNMSTSVRKVDFTGWSADAPFKESEPFNRYDEMMRRFSQRVNFDDEKVYTADYELELYRLLLKACGVGNNN